KHKKSHAAIGCYAALGSPPNKGPPKILKPHDASPVISTRVVQTSMRSGGGPPKNLKHRDAKSRRRASCSLATGCLNRPMGRVSWRVLFLVLLASACDPARVSPSITHHEVTLFHTADLHSH